ncbi:MAG: polysaccharide deacetylase family protein [Paludibacter sp.]
MISFKLRLIREQNRIYTFVLKLLSQLRKGPEVYLFHDIPDSKADVKSEFALSQASFESFLLRQLEQGKQALTFQQLSEQIEGKAPKQKNSFYVSFDDCNTGVYTKAYPFLKQHKIPFILFITRDLIGKNNFLTAEQIMIMAKDPLCTIGSHAVHHQMFRYMTASEAKAEYEQSRSYLQQLTGQPIDCFAFPYGRLVECSCKNIRTLSESVYDFAFSAIAGNLSLKGLTGKYYLPRVNVSEKMVRKN